jgi:hypothetical protein
MKHTPILFSTAMVQAILDGRKTQTRRVVKPQPDGFVDDPHYETIVPYNGKIVNGLPLAKSVGGLSPAIKCPYGQPGDVLWVRETWCPDFIDEVVMRYVYKADNNEDRWKWKPSIHMPREAARLFLRIKSVRVERLLEISEEDALAEGIGRIKVPHRNYELVYRDYLHHGVFFPVPLPSFTSLWQSINGPESWEANPWVWVVEFERITREEAGL